MFQLLLWRNVWNNLFRRGSSVGSARLLVRPALGLGFFAKLELVQAGIHPYHELLQGFAPDKALMERLQELVLLTDEQMASRSVLFFRTDGRLFEVHVANGCLRLIHTCTVLIPKFFDDVGMDGLFGSHLFEFGECRVGSLHGAELAFVFLPVVGDANHAQLAHQRSHGQAL